MAPKKAVERSDNIEEEMDTMKLELAAVKESIQEVGRQMQQQLQQQLKSFFEMQENSRKGQDAGESSAKDFSIKDTSKMPSDSPNDGNYRGTTFDTCRGSPYLAETQSERLLGHVQYRQEQ